MSTTRFVSRWFEHLKPTSRKKQMHAAKEQTEKEKSADLALQLGRFRAQKWNFNLFRVSSGTCQLLVPYWPITSLL
jgi:hypothetical protein